MAIVREINTETKENHTVAENIAYYILNFSKSKCRFCGGSMVDDDIEKSIKEVADLYGEKQEVQLRHFTISFSEDEQVDTVKARVIGKHLIEILGYAYQALYAVHDDTDTLHVHLLINPICYLDGRHFCETDADYERFIRFLASVLSYDFGLITQIPC